MSQQYQKGWHEENRRAQRNGEGQPVRPRRQLGPLRRHAESRFHSSGLYALSTLARAGHCPFAADGAILGCGPTLAFAHAFAFLVVGYRQPLS
jgi:hypothetical protein